MAKGFLLKDNLTKDTLLKIAGMGLLTAVVITSPHFLHVVVKAYFKEKTREMIRKRARKLWELQKRKLIEFKEMADGSVKITLTHLGKNLIRQYKLDEMTLPKHKQWDKKWRWLIYDIPNYKRKASLALSKKLHTLGLYKLQKSIWIFPYEIMPEIEFLCAVFEIDMNNWIHYFKTMEVPKEKEVKEFFNLK